MAIIGAEGQRGLSYALRREEQKNNTLDDRTARQRATLANKLTEASFDPDIDNPSLAYYATAMNADPTGIVGGLASALGSVQMMKATDTKRDALKTEREMDASLLTDRLKTAFGEDVISKKLAEVDPEGKQKNNPDFLAKVFTNLEENRNEKIEANKRALDTARDAIEFGDIARKNKAQEDFDSNQPERQLFLEQLGVRPDLARHYSSDKEAMAAFMDKTVWRMADADRRKKMYSTLKPSLMAQGITEQMFMNLPNLPPQIATNLINNALANKSTGVVQGEAWKLYESTQRLMGENTPAYERALDNLIPFQIPGEPGQEAIPTPEFKRWVVNYANANKGSDIDLDDPLDEQYAEAIGELGKGNYNNLGRMYQQEMSSKSETFDEDIQNALGNDPAIRAALNNTALYRSKLQGRFQSNPGYNNTAVPTYEHPEQIDNLNPGEFFRMPNGGAFITVGGNSHQTMGVERYGMSPESIYAPSLKEEGIGFTPSANSKTNAGYRPVTKEEMQIVEGLEGMMQVPNLNTMPQSDESKILGAGAEKDVTGKGEGASGDGKSEGAPNSGEITEQDIQKMISNRSFAPRVRDPDQRRQIAIRFLQGLIKKEQDPLRAVQWYSK